MSNLPVSYGRGFEHGEPGTGMGGAPAPRIFNSEPVNFINRHPLFNDPEATPLLPPYTGNPNEPTIPGYEAEY